MTAVFEAHLTGTEEIVITRFSEESSSGRRFVTVQARQPGTTTPDGAYRGASTFLMYIDVESLNTAQNLIRTLEAAIGYLTPGPPRSTDRSD